MDHHRDGLFRVLLGIQFGIGESHHALFGLFVSTLSDEPPRRGGAEVDPDCEWEGPDPLEGEGELPADVSFHVESRPYDA